MNTTVPQEVAGLQHEDGRSPRHMTTAHRKHADILAEAFADWPERDLVYLSEKLTALITSKRQPDDSMSTTVDTPLGALPIAPLRWADRDDGWEKEIDGSYSRSAWGPNTIVRTHERGQNDLQVHVSAIFTSDGGRDVGVTLCDIDAEGGIPGALAGLSIEDARVLASALTDAADLADKAVLS